MLEDFHTNKTHKWKLRGEHRSRFIQQRLKSATSDKKETIFNVPRNALQIIQDVFGNRIIQKLLEYGTPIQKTILANTVDGNAFYPPPSDVRVPRGAEGKPSLSR